MGPRVLLVTLSVILAPLAPAGTKTDDGAQLKEVLSTDTTIGGPGVVVDVRRTVMVPGKLRLTLRPGTIMRFYPGSGLTVSGHLSAVGTQDQPIVFTARDKRRGWKGIGLSAATAEMSWCVVTLAKIGLSTHATSTVKMCAFVRNATGVRSDGRGVYEDVAVIDSLRDGILGIEGARGRDKFTRVTIAGSGAVGYHGTHKAFPMMDLCRITANRGGGYLGENMFNRGSPVITNCNIHDNGLFDIRLERGDSYKLNNVHVGKRSSAILAKDPTALVRNIIDAKRTKSPQAGIVIIEQIAVEPVPDTGVSREVAQLAAKYRSSKGRR